MDTATILTAVLTGATVYVAYLVFFPKPAPRRVNRPVAAKAEPAQTKALTGIPMKVMWGSQSGTAERMANELVEEAKAYGYAAESIDLEGYDPEDLSNESFCVFLMATYGEGEPTDNAAAFYEWLEATAGRDEDDFCENLQYSVFALGSSQYEHFCYTGTQTHKLLKKIGAKDLIDVMTGDDDADIDEDFDAWKEAFWQASHAKFGTKAQERKFEPAFTFQILEEKTAPDFYRNYKSGLEGYRPDPKTGGCLLKVVGNTELLQDTSNGSASTYAFDVDLKGMPISYMTADNMGIYPRNSFKEAAKVAKRLGYDTRHLMKYTKNDRTSTKRLPYPTVCSIQDALVYYCDISQVVRTRFLSELARYAGPKDQNRIKYYLSEGKNEYSAKKLTLLEVLTELTTVQIPYGEFFEICPSLKPRLYTISSSSKVQRHMVTLTVALETATVRDKLVKGITTSYMQELRPEKDSIFAFVRPSSFRLPRTPSTPVIMIGPGTGLAPFRAFVQEAKFLTEEKGKKLGDWHLFFGCRKRNQDFIWKEELQTAEEAGLVKLHLAFSREQEEKVYVQHLILKQAETLAPLIKNSRAHIYVCGAVKMGRDVKSAFIKILQSKDTSEKQATDLVDRMHKQGRYVAELWS